ncbi:MAG: VWA domain-containing protein, partial [Firmicutes bacterium]|nr:VWA domain-containing protein [Bacillota bacterium]
MIGFFHGKIWRWVLLIGVVILGSGGFVVEAADESQKTYIEFVFDASFSMNEEVEKGKSRMDVAKEVMIDLIQNLEDRPGLEVGLRVYGAKNTNCDDSVLVQDFGPVDAVRSNILSIVKGLKPKGKTPIAYSLEQAAQDFPSKDDRNIIVLITDGQESCGGDPCAVSYYLQAQGIIYKPHVVGFAMSAAEESRVSCIGTYYSAKDRKSLSEALASIMRKVVAPAELEIEAWAGGRNVTSETVFTIADGSGSPLVDSQQGKGDFFRKELPEGSYGVKGVFQLGSTVLEATQSSIKLGEGESKRIRLDFGELEAKLEVEVTYRQANVTSDTKLVISRQNKQEVAFGTGAQVFSYKGVPGQVDLKVTYAGGISVEKTVTGVSLDAGKTNRVTVELDDLLGTLRAKVKAGEKDVTLKAEVVANDGQHKVQLSPQGEYLA